MIVESLATQSPMMLVYFVGLVLAIVNYGKHPKPAMLMMLGCIGLLIATIGRTVVVEYLIFEEGFGSGYRFIYIIGNIFEACALGLVIAAVFAARTKPKSPRRDDYDDAPRDRREMPLARPKPPAEPRGD